MMSSLAELLVIVLFFSISSLLVSARKGKTILACFIVFWAFFYDYISFYLKTALGFDIFSIKLFFEILVMTAFVALLLRRKFEIADAIKILVIISMALFAAMVGFFDSLPVRMIYVDFRAIFLPLVLCSLLLSIKYFDVINIRLVFCFGIFMVMLNGMISVWDYATFSGDYESIWRYQSLLQSKLELYQNYNPGQLVYQVIRGDELRSSGFIVSALTASYIYAFCAIFFLYQLLGMRKEFFVFNVVLFFFMLAFIYVTQVRAGFLMVFFSFFVMFFYKFSHCLNLKKITMFLVPSVTFLLMVFYLMTGEGIGIDSSSLGRLVQYNYLALEFNLVGYGLGSFPGMFDSFFIYTLLEMGMLSFLLLYVIYKMLTSAVSHYYRDFVYAQFSTFIFLCTFQHVAGSVYYFFFIFYLMCLSRQAVANTIKNKIVKNESDIAVLV
ncbi:hypothetical protein [Zobellella sp. DQSA1]|uniref:hypothetical protein n=1 Tax=Zobellella sp. DQSA1 TaxID=3342386 RepID=UPI0035C2406F